MKKTTMKALRTMVNHGEAAQLHAYDASLHLETLAISRGIYGANGALFRDRKSGQLYAVIGRSTLLLQYI